MIKKRITGVLNPTFLYDIFKINLKEAENNVIKAYWLTTEGVL